MIIMSRDIRKPHRKTAYAIILCFVLFWALQQRSAHGQSEVIPVDVQNDFAQGRFADAERKTRELLLQQERRFGAESKPVLPLLDMLAVIYAAQKRYQDAESLLRRTLNIREQKAGSDSAAIAETMEKLADVYARLRRFDDAERFWRRAAELQEKAFGRTSPVITRTLDKLATMLFDAGRADEAEALWMKGIGGLGHLRPLPEIKQVRTDSETGLQQDLELQALNAEKRGAFAEAERIYSQLIARAEAGAHPMLRQHVTGLARVLIGQQRFSEAAKQHERALSLEQREFGANSPGAVSSARSFADLYRQAKRYAEEERLRLRALAMVENSLGANHSAAAPILQELAAALEGQGRKDEAYPHIRRAVRIAASSFTYEALASVEPDHASRKPFETLITSAFALSQEKAPHATAPFMSDAFEAAQWLNRTRASAALAQMAARFAAKGDELAALARELQDLSTERKSVDQQLVAAISEPQSQRNPGREQTLRAQLQTLDARLGADRDKVQAQFPRYSALVDPRPLSIEEAKELLRPDEALILYEINADAVFAWAVTANNAPRWERLGLGREELAKAVAALRCGLDRSEWEDPKREDNCRRLLGSPYGAVDLDRSPLPFPLGKAHMLYQTLLGPFEDMIKGRTLLIVPAGALSSLPLQTLVTEKPAGPTSGSSRLDLWESYRGIPWLVRRQAIVTVPSAASLAGLRRSVGKSRASKPFIGFGAPDLRGSPACGKKTDSGDTEDVRRGIEAYFRDGGAIGEELHKLCPLPQAAEELRSVAASLGAGSSDVILGASANERLVKDLSKTGALAGYRIIDFATHGLLAGESAKFVPAKAEPALVLTPPLRPEAEDDGLLTASEAALLKLDADWVVLSACNTAAGARDDAEALSGLARAFFYAGARTLLVSHWPVDSNAATALVAGSFPKTRDGKTALDDNTANPGELLRRSIIALMDGAPVQSVHPVRNAHPAIWAPFSVIGGR